MRAVALITRFITAVGGLFQCADTRLLIPVISVQARTATARPATARCGMVR